MFATFDVVRPRQLARFCYVYEGAHNAEFQEHTLNTDWWDVGEC